MTALATHAVVLPGTGSDATFAADAFGPALADAGVSVVAVEPEPRGVVATYENALDAAADRYGRILVGGISIGAAIAAAWALRHPTNVTAILAALPAWLGPAGDSPAAQSAEFTAAALDRDGLDAVVDAMTASSPSWLAEALTRSWRSQWPALPTSLREAAAYVAPDVSDLARLSTRTSIVGATDDAVHPIVVAETWQRTIPDATLAGVTLAEIGRDPSVIGRLAVAGLTRIGS